MTEEQEKPTLFFNEEEYVIEELSDTSKYIINQLQDLNNQIMLSKNRLEQLEVSKRGYIDMLELELGKEKGPE